MRGTILEKKIIPIINKKWPKLNKVMQHNIMLQDKYRKITTDYCEIVYEHIITENKIDINILKKYQIIFYRYFYKILGF